MATEAQGANGQGAAARILGSFNPEDAQHMIEQGREALDQAVDKATAFIRERPIVCLASALAIGYVVGKIVSR
jgi:ElaB/YqjD/DUF883 family membrane-anchored ribosome-binding protein